MVAGALIRQSYTDVVYFLTILGKPAILTFMIRTKVFTNGGSLAVRIPKDYALPLGDVMIDQRDGMLVLLPIDDKGRPSDLETRFSALSDLDAPVRPRDAKPIHF